MCVPATFRHQPFRQDFEPWDPTFLCPICGIPVMVRDQGIRLNMVVQTGTNPDGSPQFSFHECVRPAISARPDCPTPRWVLTRILTTLELMYPQALSARWLGQDEFGPNFPRRVIWEALTELRMDGKIEILRDTDDTAKSLFRYIVPAMDLLKENFPDAVPLGREDDE